MAISLHKATKELEFIKSIGGLCPANAEYVQRIVDQFGENAGEIFQEFAEDLRTLAELNAVEPAFDAAQM